jgi:hypothetical protein
VSDRSSIEIRSYRTVFALERRIYRIDHLRLNPGGVPVRGVIYGVMLSLAVLVLAHLPLAEQLLAVLPWYLRVSVLPWGAAALLTVIRVEGRSFHLAAYAIARHTLAARRLRGLRPCRSPAPGGRWHPPELLLLADGSDPRLRRLRFTGPGAALITVSHACTASRVGARLGAARLAVYPVSPQRQLTSGRVLKLERGVRLDVHGATG